MQIHSIIDKSIVDIVSRYQKILAATAPNQLIGSKETVIELNGCHIESNKG
jgi:hypothetical protein